MKKYEMLELKVIFFYEQDIITNSTILVIKRIQQRKIPKLFLRT